MRLVRTKQIIRNTRYIGSVSASDRTIMHMARVAAAAESLPRRIEGWEV